MNPSNQPSVIYQAEPQSVQAIHACREKVVQLCKEHMHRPVRVQTLEGMTVEGIIVHVDTMHVYLSVPQSPGTARAFISPFFNPFYNQYYYNNVILPLVLFDLLAITLI